MNLVNLFIAKIDQICCVFFGTPGSHRLFLPGIVLVVLYRISLCSVSKGLCKAISLHLHGTKKSKNCQLKIDGPDVLLIIDSQRNNAVFAHFLCSMYRAAYLPVHIPFKYLAKKTVLKLHFIDM